VFIARPLSHYDFLFLIFFLFLPDVVVPLRGVGPLLPAVAAIPADVDDLHGDIWNLLRDQDLFKEFVSLICRVFSLCSGHV
jgi:hypothetical protein